MRRWSQGAVKSAILPIVVAALLPLLAFLQYRWIGQISAAERDRLQNTLRTAVARLNQDFNREISRGYVMLEANRWQFRNAPEFADRFNAWAASANYPHLVKDIYRVEDLQSAAKFTHFDPASGEFEPAEWPARFHALRTRLRDLAAAESPGAGRFTGFAVQDDIPALVAPIFKVDPRRGDRDHDRDWNRRPEMRRAPDGLPPADGGGPPRQSPQLAGLTILELNQEFIRNTMLPELLTRHLHNIAGEEYQSLIVRKADPTDIIYRSDADLTAASIPTPDVTVTLLDIRPELLMGGGFRRSTRPPTGRFNAAAAPPTNRINPDLDGGRWIVKVKHRSGSLDTVVDRVRYRNLGVSFAILIILGASMVLLIVSSRRAEFLARHQMEFVAGVSHELRTPVAVICSAADNLADGLVGTKPQAQQYGAVIRNEGRRLASMVEQILGFAGAQSGRKQYDISPVAVEDAIDQAIRSAAFELQQSGLRVEKFIAPNTPAVMADATALAQAIANLLANAAKYAAAGGVAIVRAYADGRVVSISVEDRGEGIDPADLPHIFDPFYRGERVVAAQVHGVGLGLSIVKRFIEAQGGRISVRNAHPAGASFTIELPAAPASSPPSETAPAILKTDAE